MIFPKGYAPVSPIDVTKLDINDTWKDDESFIETHRQTIETTVDENGSVTTIEWYKGVVGNPVTDFMEVVGHRIIVTPRHVPKPNVNFNVEVAWYSEYRGVTHNIDRDTYYEFHVNEKGEVISQCDASKYGNPNNRHVKAVLAELAKRKQTISEF